MKLQLPSNPQLLFSVILCLLLQAWLAITLEINWDEFFFLSHLYDFQRGELAKALQSLQVHLLGWITLLPGNEIDQIIVGRFVMLVFLSGTCVLIYQLARTFFAPAPAAVAVLAYAAAGPTMIHGASFRADPMAACFAMLSLVTLARGETSFRAAMLAGAAVSVAAMITVKVVLYAPAFLGIVLWRFRRGVDRKRTLLRLTVAALTAGGLFAVLYLLQLSLIERSSVTASQEALGNAVRTALISPKWNFVFAAAQIATVQSIILVTGTVGVLIRVLSAEGSQQYRLVAIALAGATLSCLFYYRNVFPYFFPFILPPAMLLVAWVVDHFSVFRRSLWLTALLASLLLPAVMIAASWLALREQPAQRHVVQTVRSIFPEPVPMIDHFHVIGSFPKRGFFMSTWGMEKYRNGEPIFEKLLRSEAVPLLLIDGPVLAEALDTPEFDESSWRSPLTLFNEDRAILAENFVPYWGPVWVAGKRLIPSSPEREFTIHIPGAYRLQGEAILINGQAIRNGDVIHLDRGAHKFEATSSTERRLVWAKAGPTPSVQPPKKLMFSQFFGWAAD